MSDIVSTDINFLMEIKKNGIWMPVGKKVVDYYLTYEFKRSVLTCDSLIPLIFCQRIVSGGYNIDLIPFIRNDCNGAPNDMSSEALEYLKYADYKISGFVTRHEIDNFNWDFKIYYQCQTTSKEKEIYLSTGKIPEYTASFGTSLVDIEFTRSFLDTYREWFNEIEYLKFLGKDYRYLYYFN